MITLAIDADPMIYAAGSVVQQEFFDVRNKRGQDIATFEGKTAFNVWLKEHDKKEKDFIVEKRIELEPIEAAFGILNTQLYELKRLFQAEQVLVFLTDDKKGVNFREYVAMQRKYKDRPNKQRPFYYKQLRAHLIDKHNAIVTTGYEADDAVAFQNYATQAHEDSETVIVSIDKDLQMVPGRHYNPDKKILKTITPEEGRHKFYVQVLMGDTTDTIPGLPRVGEKKAEGLLEGCETEEEYFRVALAAYKKAFGNAGPNVMVETARLVWMMRFPGDCWLPNGYYLKELLA